MPGVPYHSINTNIHVIPLTSHLIPQPVLNGISTGIRADHAHAVLVDFNLNNNFAGRVRLSLSDP